MNTTTATVKRVVAFARAFGSWQRCLKAGNDEWRRKHEDALDALNSAMPHGSGFDCGTKLNEHESTPNRLVFETSFHHMDDYGFYCDWSEHKVIVTPEFEAGFDVRITGRDVRGIKEYISEQFSYALDEEIPRLTGYPPAEAKQETAAA